MSCAACRRALAWPVRQHLSRRPQRQQARAQSGSASASASSPPRVVFSGIQPTGVPHLGNYLGALQQWKRLQDEAAPDTKLLFSIVDLHAITVPRPKGHLRRSKRELFAALLAVGLDPERSIIFHQSSVPAHAELMWILSCSASVGYLSRMTQWKACRRPPPSSSARRKTCC